MSWSYLYNTQIWPALIALGATVGLGWYSWRRRNLLAAKPFAIACLFGALWTFGTTLEVSAVDFSTKVFWFKFQAIWQLPSAAAILCFILAYAGLARWLNRRNVVLISLVPLLGTVVIATNDFHHLMWTGFQIHGHVIASSGSLYWVFNSYVYLTGLVNLAVLLWLAIRSPAHRWPVTIIMSGQIIARVGYTLNKLDTGLIGAGESVLLTIGIVSTAYAVAFFRFHAIDPIATARTAVLGQMQEGMLVLDLQGHIVDANPAAAAILRIPEIDLRNKLFVKVMPVDIDAIGRVNNDRTGQSEIMLGKGNSDRYYNLNQTPLRDRNGELVGRLLLLHDITEQKRSQAKVIEQQRVVATLQERERLARELHDSTSQVLGYVNLQTQTIQKWLQDGNNKKAEDSLIRLAEVARDAHVDVRESILGLKAGSGQEWSFFTTLKQYLNDFQEHYNIHTNLALSDGIGENTFDAAAGIQLLRVIQEALTNARKHSGARNIRISMGEEDSKAFIRIADDGSGFGASNGGQDTESHFGMVFMHERITEIGGSLKIDSKPGEGTVVELNVPIKQYREESYESIAG